MYLLHISNAISNKVKVKVALEQVTKVQRGSRGLYLYSPSTLPLAWALNGVGGHRRSGRFPPGKDPVPIL